MKNQKEIDRLFDFMEPIKGEKRTVNKCNSCGKLFGRRFVPYGLGNGETVSPCSCIISNNDNHGSITLAERKP